MTRQRDLEKLEEFIMGRRVEIEAGAADYSNYKLEFVLADKEAGKDRFVWDASSIEGVSDHFDTLYRKFKDRVFVFAQDLGEQPKPNNSVKFANILTILQDSDKELLTTSRFCHSIEDVEKYISEQPAEGVDEDVYEIHVLIYECNSQGGYENMFKNIVKSFTDLKSYARTLPWFAQVSPSDDNPSGDETG